MVGGGLGWLWPASPPVVAPGTVCCFLAEAVWGTASPWPWPENFPGILMGDQDWAWVSVGVRVTLMSGDT